MIWDPVFGRNAVSASVMEEPYKQNIRLSHYRFLTGLNCLNAVFDNAESYRFQRHTELYKHISENSYQEFLEKFGKETLNEFFNIELWYKYQLIHSIFISAYSAFESQLMTVAQILEREIPSKKKIKDFTKGSLINQIRTYLYSVHWLTSADSTRTLWNEIDTFRLVRNLIVHHASRLSSNHPQRQEIKTLFNSYNVAIDHNTTEFYIREKKFLTDFLDKIKAYSWDLVTETAPVPSLPSV